MSKSLSKSIFANNKRTVGTIFAAGALAAIMVVGTVAADGPTFNIFPIAYDGSLNTDYPLLDARNVSKSEGWSTSQADHDAGVTADPGETLEFLVYYHNGAPDAPENIATNVNLRATLPGSAGNLFTVGAILSASNAATVASTGKGGDITVRVNGSLTQTLSLVSGSTVWYPNRGSSQQVMPDTITGGGIALGSIQGCWNFAGFVKFRAQVSSNQPTHSLSVTKSVRKLGTGSYGSSVNLNPTEIAEFRIVGTNTGTGVIFHFIFTDTLPAKLTFVPGTLQVSPNTPLSGNLFSGGLDAGTVHPGGNVTLTFQAQVDPSSAFPVGTTTLTNNVSLLGQGPTVGPQTASAQVLVTITAPQVCTVQARATLDGAAWSGSLSYTIPGPSVINGATVPQDFTGVQPGTYDTYTAGTPSGGPANSTFNGVTPISGNCPAGGSLMFTYQYTLNRTYNFTISKLVRNLTTGSAFADSVNAQPSQTVEFKIEIQNTGNTTLTNLTVRDALPSLMTYSPSTLTINGTAISNASAFFASGVNVGSILAGEIKTVVFTVVLAGQNSFPVGTTTLINTGYAVATGVAEKSDTATVVVNKSAPVKENGNPSGRP